jgi:hypothetical protein
MKLLIVLSLSAGILAASDGPAKKNPPAPASAASARTEPGQQIPVRAVQSADGSYHFTDSEGRQWIYRKTPFGISRWQDKPEDAAALAADNDKRYEAVTATETGDTIHFERRGPFGTSRWDRKKADLDEVEKTIWNRERSRTAVKQD